MSAPTVTAEPPRLIPVEGGSRERTVDEIVRLVLAEPVRSRCVVCNGRLDVVTGGVRCSECHSELLVGVEPTMAWAA